MHQWDRLCGIRRGKGGLEEVKKIGGEGKREKGEDITAVRVGHTQSNMSAPRATETTRSSGYPTPITYRGLFCGSQSVQ